MPETPYPDLNPGSPDYKPDQVSTGRTRLTWVIPPDYWVSLKSDPVSILTTADVHLPQLLHGWPDVDGQVPAVVLAYRAGIVPRFGGPRVVDRVHDVASAVWKLADDFIVVNRMTVRLTIGLTERIAYWFCCNTTP